VVEFLGKSFEILLNPLLDGIRRDGIGAGIAAIIIFLGLVFAVIIIYQAIIEAQLLHKARFIFEASLTEAEFANNYNTINEDILCLPKIKSAWQEFSETLILPESTSDGTIMPCSNTERPQEFFNLHDLNMGPGFTKALPSIFIGVGLSLTFFGLISALSSAAEGIQAAGGDTLAIQNAIKGLLNAASAKFYASLFALFTSICLTVLIKGSSWWLEGELKKINIAIENGVRHLTLESLSLQGNVIMQNQLAQLQTFNTDLAMQIGEQVQASLERTLAPFVETIADIGTNISDGNIENIRQITNEVTATIQGAAGDSMDRVASTLDAVSDKLGGLTDILSGALSSFDSDFKHMLDGLKTSLQDSTHSVAEGVSKTMAGMNDGIQESATTVTGLVNDLAGTIETLSRSGEEIAARGGEALSASVSAAAEAAGESITKAGQELSNGFKDSTADLITSFSLINNQILALDKSLSGMPDNLNKINDKLAESSESINNASIQFRAAGGGLQAVIEPLSTFAVETRSLMQELTNSLDVSSKSLASASDLINESVEVIRTEVKTQIAQLSGSDEHLATLLGGIETSTEKVLQSIATYVTGIDRGFSSSLGLLENSIATLEETIAAQISAANNESKS